MMSGQKFEFYALNRLDQRPEPLLPESPALADLEKAFAFLFKPNRVLALHPRGPEYDPGWPVQDGLDRWLIKLNPDSGRFPVNDLPVCLLTLTPHGRLALWRFHPQSREGRPSGLYPLHLKNLGGNQSSEVHPNIITLKIKNSASSYHPPPRLRLLRLTQLTDADGWHHLRIETRRGRHLLEFDLTCLQREQPLKYYYTAYAHPQGEMPNLGYSQIGGWNGDDALHWRDREGKILLQRSLLEEDAARDSPIRLYTAARHGDWVIAGGEDTRLLRFYYDHREPQIIFSALKGYVFTLALLQSPREAKPYILAGCDDYTLYVLNQDGKILQKVCLDGRVQGIVELDTRPEWADLAIITRNRGLFCARLFFEHFHLSREHDEVMRQRFREALESLAGAPPLAGLQRWLPDNQNPARQRVALAGLLAELDRDKVELFQPQTGLSGRLDDQTLDYLGHALERLALKTLAKKQQSDDQLSQGQLPHLIRLLLYLSQGPFYARMTVRRLEGLLAMLEQTHLREADAFLPAFRAELKEALEALFQQLPDAKRYLRRLANELCLPEAGESRPALNKLDLFFSVCERLRHEKAFNEIILRLYKPIGAIRAVCMVGQPGRELWHVWAYSDAPRLYAFRNNVTPERVTPMLDHSAWCHRLYHPNDPEAFRRRRQPVRGLYPLDSETLLVLANHCLGLARRGESAVEWGEETSNALYACCAMRREAEGELLIVVGGEWKPAMEEGGSPLLYLYRLEVGQSLVKLGEFPAPEDFSPFTLRALAWEDNGDLWGVTSGQGWLLRWPGANRRFGALPEIVETLPSSQYALAIREKLILCGGEDGVVRAFGPRGELCWNFIAKGAVRAIQVLPDTETTEARFAVISEEEHLWTLNERGEQHNLFFLPQRHPLALYSGIIRPGRAVHHLVGSLEGEIRLVEMVITRDIWNCPSYLEDSLDFWDSDQQIQTCIRQARETIQADRDTLRAWCEKQPIGGEPMRTAWALRKLVEKYDDFATALDYLDRVGERTEPSILKFRAHVFGVLGRHFERLPESLLPRLARHCKTVQDGSLGSLIYNSRDSPELPRALLRLGGAISDKLGRAKAFTSSALLQTLGGAEANSEVLEHVLLRGLRQASRHSDFTERLHWGFLEGVLVLLFRELGVNQSLVEALSRLCSHYPRLARAFKHDRRHCLQFINWLNHYAGILFTLKIHATWRLLSPHLAVERMEDFQLEVFLHDLDHAQDLTREDRALLAKLAGLFPETPEFKPWPGAPDPWENLVTLTGKFREIRERIQQARYTSQEIKRELEKCQEKLDKYQPKSALLGPLQQAWQTAWREEFEQLQRNTLPGERADYLHLSEEPLFFVGSEPMPLVLHLRNAGPEDLDCPVRLWLDEASAKRVVKGHPTEIETGGLRCARGVASPGDRLTLRTLLYPLSTRQQNKELELTVYWRVDEEDTQQRSQLLRLTPRARWSQYRENYPEQDKLANELFGAWDNEKNTFRYRRILLRVWRESGMELSARELVKQAGEWADRHNRGVRLKLITTETYWPGAEPISPHDWKQRLEEAPPTDWLEVWLVENSLPWNLAFLHQVAQSPATALFLPQLTVADPLPGASRAEQEAGGSLRRRLPGSFRNFLDMLLSPRGKCGLAPLQWALKACIQAGHVLSVAEARREVPLLLARPARHGRQRLLSRGERPEPRAWQDPQSGAWLVAGVPTNIASLITLVLPVDACRPLAALVTPEVFKWLALMGLVEKRRHLWVPRAACLFEYVDEVFPPGHLREPSANESPIRRHGQMENWSQEILRAARNQLFGRREQEPPFPPHEGFGFREWQLLRQYAEHHPLPPDFYSLIGLPGSDAYQTIQANQQHWQHIMQGREAAQASLPHYLGKHKIKVEKTRFQPRDRRYQVISLDLDLASSHFRYLTLILFSETFRQALARDEELVAARLSEVLKEIQENLDDQWSASIFLILYEMPWYLRERGELRAHELVFLGERQLNRLMSTRREVRDTLLEIVQTQVPLAKIAEHIFTTQGPVPPAYFFGRIAPLKRLTEGLLAGKSYVITGPRQIGKSSLLRYLPNSPQWNSRLGKRFHPISMDFQEQRYGLSYPRFLQGLMSHLKGISLPESRRVEILEEIDELLALDNGENDCATGHRGRAVRLAERIMDHIELAARAKNKIPLYLFDEADGFYTLDSRCNEPMFTLFRARHNRGSGQFLFASYPPQAESMAGTIQDANRQSYNFVEQEVLSPLEIGEGMDLVRISMRLLAVKVSEPKARRIAEESFAIPNLLQHACLTLCQGLQAQIERGEGNEVSDRLIGEATHAAQKNFMDVLFSQLQPEEIKFTLAGLVLDGRHRFTLDEAYQALRHHAGADWSRARLKRELRKVLQTLILSYDMRSGQYRFAGPEDRPYFPTMTLNVHGRDGLEDMMLRDMETDDQD